MSTDEGEVVAAVSKADQAAWEAPALRSTFTPDGQTEKWAYPCPEWCSGEGRGHDGGRIVHGRREHQSHELLVRQDGPFGYYDEYEGREGVRSANIGVSLVTGSRQAMEPAIQMDIRFGRMVDGRTHRKEWSGIKLFPDEARELIAVLQHLLKVASEQ